MPVNPNPLHGEMGDETLSAVLAQLKKEKILSMVTLWWCGCPMCISEFYGM